MDKASVVLIKDFKSKISEYIELINQLEDYERPGDNLQGKSLMEELNGIFPKIEDILFSIGKMRTINLVTRDGDNGNIYYASLSNLYVFHLKPTLDRINQDLAYVISKVERISNMTEEELLLRVKRMQEIMIEYSCGGYHKDYEENGEKYSTNNEYQKLYVEILDEFKLRGYDNKNSYLNLYDFYLYYKDTLKHYADRRKYIRSLYLEISDELEVSSIRNKLEYDEVYKNLVIDSSIDSEDQGILNIINHSKTKFFSLSSTIQDKKDAINNLADCLEKNKSVLNKSTYFSSQDSSDLFNIANSFGIRHLNKNQKMDYDKEVFYEWIYLTYYNSLKLIISLNK